MSITTKVGEYEENLYQQEYEFLCHWVGTETHSISLDVLVTGTSTCMCHSQGLKVYYKFLMEKLAKHSSL